RVFACPSATAAVRKVLVALGAGAGVGTARFWVDGVELSPELSSANPANTLTLGTTATTLGGRSVYASGWDGQLTRWYIWNADFGAVGNAADLARALAL
ncbi:MAG TPA: hypothetical protein VK509_24085, partial [Polyangiales bacterium]|nr:hypothetical protein [Polyangiales bacterium]